MANSFQYNFILKATGENKVIVAKGKMQAGLVNVKKATVNVDKSFSHALNHINASIVTIRLSAI